MGAVVFYYLHSVLKYSTVAAANTAHQHHFFAIDTRLPITKCGMH